MNTRPPALKTLATQALLRAGACSRPVNTVNAEMNTIEGVGSVLGAVRLTSPLIGDYWLVADDDDEMTPDILGAGLPVFRFREVPFLRGLAPADLQAVAAVKRAFPTSEVIQ